MEVTSWVMFSVAQRVGIEAGHPLGDVTVCRVGRVLLQFGDTRHLTSREWHLIDSDE